MDGAAGKTIRRTLTLRKDAPVAESNTRAQVSNAPVDAEASSQERLKVRRSDVYGRMEQMGLPSSSGSSPAHRVEVYCLVTQREKEQIKPTVDPQSVTDDIDDAIPLGRLPTQDWFLAALCRECIPAKFLLTDGVCISGRIRAFDTFTILVESQETVLLYKRFIGTIVPEWSPTRRP